MRFEKPENIVRLALHMQSSAEGLCLQDIQSEFKVSRRTAERMRDAVGRLFPIEEASAGDRLKRWKIGRQALASLLTVSTNDLADLETAIKLLQADDLDLASNRLRGLWLKLKNLVGRRMRAVEEDLEVLAEAEGLATRPGPRRRIDGPIFEALRESITKCNKVRLHYWSSNTKKSSRQTVCPYGFLYGHRHYLVAYNEDPDYGGFKLFVLGNIRKVDQLYKSFARQQDFSLQDYANRSFGVFQEEPFDVVWRFNKDVAEEAKDFVFHPSQAFEDQPDGSVLVKFRAGGAVEMVWHLFSWGDTVEVLEPAHLRDLLQEWKSY